MSEIANIKTVIHESFEVNLRSDGIVHVHMIAHTKITIELQGELEIAYHEVTSVKRPFIFTGGEFVTITAKARANAAESANKVPILCSAIVVRNLAQKIIADYYYRFNKPPNPYKVFKTFENGIEWLEDNFEIPAISD